MASHPRLAEAQKPAGAQARTTYRRSSSSGQLLKCVCASSTTQNDPVHLCLCLALLLPVVVLSFVGHAAAEGRGDLFEEHLSAPFSLPPTTTRHLGERREQSRNIQ